MPWLPLMGMMAAYGGQASAPPPAPPVQKQLAIINETIPYRKSDEYFKPGKGGKLWEPDRFPIQALKGYAEGVAEVVARGHLDPKVADLMLANALVEGRHHSDFGLNETWKDKKGVEHPNYDVNAAAHKELLAPRVAQQQAYKDAAKDLNLLNPADALIFSARTKDLKPEPDSSTVAGLRAAVHMGLKARDAQRRGFDDPLKAIELWNGTGAEARRHAARVARAHELLDHPENQPLRNAFSQFYQRRWAELHP